LPELCRQLHLPWLQRRGRYGILRRLALRGHLRLLRRQLQLQRRRVPGLRSRVRADLLGNADLHDVCKLRVGLRLHEQLLSGLHDLRNRILHRHPVLFVRDPRRLLVHELLHSGRLHLQRFPQLQLHGNDNPVPGLHVLDNLRRQPGVHMVFHGNLHGNSHALRRAAHVDNLRLPVRLQLEHHELHGHGAALQRAVELHDLRAAPGMLLVEHHDEHLLRHPHDL
jgi:hypothetical protein